VSSIKYHVDNFIDAERRDHQKQRLEKRAEQLRKEGKIVIVEAPYSNMSYKEREKYEIFYGEVPEECKKCPKLGVELSGNFQQKPMCTDKKCHESMQQRQSQKQGRQTREKEKKIEEERAKVYSAPLDTHHFRLLVLGLIEQYTLSNALKLGFHEKGKVVLAVNELSREECIMLLLHEAVKHVLSGPNYYDEHDAAKAWAIKEWCLTPGLFLKEEEVKSNA